MQKHSQWQVCPDYIIVYSQGRFCFFLSFISPWSSINVKWASSQQASCHQQSFFFHSLCGDWKTWIMTMWNVDYLHFFSPCKTHETWNICNNYCTASHYSWWNIFFCGDTIHFRELISCTIITDSLQAISMNSKDVSWAVDNWKEERIYRFIPSCKVT